MKKLWIILFVLLNSSFASAQEFVLDFSEQDPEGYFPLVDQNYGDTTSIDVSYQVLAGFGDQTQVKADLNSWYTGYGDLEHVIGDRIYDPTRVSEIRFDSKNQSPIELISFDAAAWDGTADQQAFRVYDGQYNLLFERTNYDVTDVGHDSFRPEVSANTLILQWDYGFVVGLDNIVYKSTAVPEPSGFAFSAALCTLFHFRRKPRSISN